MQLILSFCAPFCPGIWDTDQTLHRSATMKRSAASSQHGATLMPLLCYLLNSRTPWDSSKREAVHDVTHIHSRQSEPEVERVERQSDGWSTSRGWRRHLQLQLRVVIYHCLLCSIHSSIIIPFIQHCTFIKITHKRGHVCVVGNSSSNNRRPGSFNRWLYQE